MAIFNAVNARVLLRNAPSTDWTLKNPILLKGELGAEIDTGLIKMGNGATPYNDLPYINITLNQLSTKLDKTGGVMSGTLTLNYEPLNDTDAVNKGYVDNKIATAGTLKREIVEELPLAQDADENTIYMIKDTSSFGPDAYKEYMLIDEELQQIGDTSVDLTNYFEKPNNYTPGNIISINAFGEIYDTGISASDIHISVNVNDLQQDEGDDLILYCGIASELS